MSLLDKVSKIKDIKIIISKKLGLEKKQVDAESNKSKAIYENQLISLTAGILIVIVVIWFFLSYINSKNLEQENTEEGELPYSVVDLPDKSLDPEKHWRNHYDDKLRRSREETSQQIKDLKIMQEEMLKNVQRSLFETLDKMKKFGEEQNDQFIKNKHDIEELLASQQQLMAGDAKISPVEIGETEFDDEIIFDDPKASSEYIPAGTFLSGNLLAGVVASTAMSAPENPTPIIIKLTGKGDLDDRIWQKGKDCRITGSSYGEASSERVIIRLEKLICKMDGSWIHTDIYGHVAGADGKPGIKGTLVSLGQKHLKNAALGGFISGLTSAAKGEQGLSVTSGGVLSTESQKGIDLLRKGGLEGISNVGDKIADYALRKADSLSDVLVIPAGVKVNPMIMKGVYFGQVNTRKNINQMRQSQNNK